MMNMILRHVNLTIMLPIFLSFVLMGLSGCGSNTGEESALSNFPACLEGQAGVSSTTGCWLSERCAHPINGLSARYLVEMTEDPNIPNPMGEVRDYLITYQDGNCGVVKDITNLRTELIDQSEAQGLIADLITTYYQGQAGICTDLAYPYADVPCGSLQTTTTYTSGDLVSVITRMIYTSIEGGDRLCVSAGQYKFDNLGQGGIFGGTTIDNAIDFSNCLSRLTVE